MTFLNGHDIMASERGHKIIGTAEHRLVVARDKGWGGVGKMGDGGQKVQSSGYKISK